MTGRNCGAGDASAVLLNSLRQVKTKLVFTSYCRATTDTDAPGADAAATISRFSASGHTFRRTRLAGVHYRVSGHLSPRQYRKTRVYPEFKNQGRRPLPQGYIPSGENQAAAMSAIVRMLASASSLPALYPWNVLAGRIKSHAYPVRRL